MSYRVCAKLRLVGGLCLAAAGLLGPSWTQQAGGAQQETLVVSRNGDAQYSSIGAALRAAPAGARVHVRPGVYNEAVVLDKKVDLVGDGSAAGIIIESTEAPCIEMKTPSATVRGLTLRGRGATKSKTFYAVSILQGQLLLEDCDITSDSLAGVAIGSANAAPTLRGCRIHDCAKSAIYIYDRARATIENCELYANTIAAVEVSGASQATFRKCTVRDGKAVGLHYRNGSRGSVENCELFQNAGAGVNISEGASPLLRNCKVYANQKAGVWVNSGGLGTLEKCELYSNSLAGLEIASGGNPTVRDCKIRDGKQGGVLVTDGGRGTLEDCEVSGNAYSGVEIRTAGDLTVQNCRVTRNKENGFYIHQDGGASVDNCDLTGNGKNGWNVEIGSVVKQTGNRL